MAKTINRRLLCAAGADKLRSGEGVALEISRKRVGVRTFFEVKLLIKGVDRKEIAVGTRWWTWRPVADLLKVVLALSRTRRDGIFFDDCGCAGDVPHGPMRKLATRRVWVGDNQNQALCCRRDAVDVQWRTDTLPMARVGVGDLSFVLKSWTTELHRVGRSYLLVGRSTLQRGQVVQVLQRSG